MRLSVLIIFFFWSASIAPAQDRSKDDIYHIYERPGGQATVRNVLSSFGLASSVKQYAVVIGVGNYSDDVFDHLPGARNDALRVYDYLTAVAGFDQVWLMTNREATKEKIEQIILDELRVKSRSQDRIFFYFTGHGISERFGAIARGYLPLSDSQRSSLSSMISMRNIGEWTDALQHVHQLFFVLDSCVSGLAGDLVMSGISPSASRDLDRPGHHLLTAGTGEQQAFATSDGSYFTRAFLDGIEGAADASFGPRAADGVVSVSELTLYIRQRLRQDLDDRDWLMTPQRTTLNRKRFGEFFFVSTESSVEVPVEVEGESTMGGASSEHDVDEQASVGDHFEVDSDFFWRDSLAVLLENEETVFEQDLLEENTGAISDFFWQIDPARERESTIDKFLEERSVLVSQLQAELSSDGCAPGGIDGVLGPNTQEAIRRYNQFKPDQCQALAGEALRLAGGSSEKYLDVLKESVDILSSCPATACIGYRPTINHFPSSRAEYKERFVEVGDGLFYTVVFSSQSEQEARDKAFALNAEYPNIFAFVYPPYRGNPYWAVMIASKTTRERATQAMRLARTSGIATDAYIWP